MVRRRVGGRPAALQIESYSIAPLSAPMGADRVRRTTLVRLSGAGQEGVGEDATPIEEDQIAFQQAAPTQPVSGDWMFASFSSHLATLDPFRAHDIVDLNGHPSLEAPSLPLPVAAGARKPLVSAPLRRTATRRSRRCRRSW